MDNYCIKCEMTIMEKKMKDDKEKLIYINREIDYTRNMIEHKKEFYLKNERFIK